MTNDRHWRLERDAEGLAWLTLDRADAATNSLSRAVLEDLGQVMDELLATPPKALVIQSGKENGFIAGADIDEFGTIQSAEDALALVRRGWDSFNRLAALPFPTLALIRGFCLGGGLELALACRYRVVVDEPGTRLGLPEVMLGIVPGWGGMTRLPRLVGAAAGLDLLLTGKTVDARKAKRLGLADECVPQRIMFNTARGVLRAQPPGRALSFLQGLMLQAPLKGFIAKQAAAKVARKARREHYPAPYAILEIWARHDGNALAVPAGDPASIVRLLETPTAKNLIRVFKLQERMKALGKEGGREFRRVHVVGAGVMGGDIAAWCALRGLAVSLQDQSAERLAPAMARAAKLFKERLKDPRRVRDALDRLIPDPRGDGVSQADLVIEAIFENLEAKQKLFRELESRVRPDAVLATNTSSIPLEDIAAAMKDPGRLLGLHFFNPVARMMLVEIVVGKATRPELVAPAAAFTRRIDRLPLPVKSAPGFLVNRILAPYLDVAMRAVEEGIAPEVVDEAALSFGMPMGPIELADTVGLDICLAVGKLLGGAGQAAPAKLTQALAAGHLGKKSGQGYYSWASGKAAKAAAGQVPAGLPERLIAPMLAEARACLAEGIVEDADLLDAGAIFGTGFAPFRGGPMNHLRQGAT
ncbi:MAG: enoyl-CoA hydratase/isomerase family protein [Betaproteobacteria bacterium]|nr:enoyl-CoA hydratase/isomerase family protein [Betaproteobacteria bacterium]